MSEYFDAEAARRRFGTEATEVLLERLPDVSPEARALLVDELQRRGLTPEQMVERAGSQGVDRERQPLGSGWFAVCFLFPGLVALIIAAVAAGRGRSRAAGDAFRAIGYGWLVRFGLGAIGVLLSNLGGG